MVEQILQLLLAGGLLLAQLPSSSSYKIHNYGFGSGGTANSSSATYSLNAISGEQSGPAATGTNYTVKSGNNQTQQANVPLAPTLDNPSSYYSKLRLIINTSGNSSDAKFAVAISKDSFASTQYVQSDGTVGGSLGTEDYQTYVAWGGATGSYIIGLDHSTNYEVKVKAMHGNFTETGFGPIASAATSPPSLIYDIDVASTDTETSPPYQIDFGSLLPGVVADSPQKIWLDIETNAEYGVRAYISGQSGGLASSSASYTINSATADLASAAEGYGGRSASTGQTGGGPLAPTSPYDGVADNIGIINSAVRQLYSSPGPVFSGRASILLKIKSKEMTPSADDYRETLTVIAAASF